MTEPYIPIDPNLLSIRSAVRHEVCAAPDQFAINRRSIKIHHANDAAHLCCVCLNQKYQLTIEYRSPDCMGSTSCISSDRNATTFPVSPCTRIRPTALHTASVPPV